MESDATRRFSSRVAGYIRYRPSYPAGLVPLLERECGLSRSSKIADIGSGTGFLAALFLQFGCEVFGVEPNAEMRAAGEKILAGELRFHSVGGSAEDTPLAAASVDFVTAGQAFHWFDRAAARTEFERILRSGGWCVLVWNERLVEGRFLEEYEALLLRYSPEYAKVDHRRMDSQVMDEFFGAGQWKLASLPNEQLFDLDGLLGRLHSSSYAPPAGSPEYDAINRDIRALFEESARGGVVAFRYETKIYYGQFNTA